MSKLWWNLLTWLVFFVGSLISCRGGNLWIQISCWYELLQGDIFWGGIILLVSHVAVDFTCAYTHISLTRARRLSKTEPFTSTVPPQACPCKLKSTPSIKLYTLKKCPHKSIPPMKLYPLNKYLPVKVYPQWNYTPSKKYLPVKVYHQWNYTPSKNISL